jgi:hypothetical protein
MFVGGPFRSRQVHPDPATPERAVRPQLTPEEQQKDSATNIKLTESAIKLLQGDLHRVEVEIRANEKRLIGHPDDAALGGLRHEKTRIELMMAHQQTIRTTQIEAWCDQYPEVDTPGTTKTELKARVKEIGVPFVRLVNRAGELQAKIQNGDVEDRRETQSNVNYMASELKRMATDWNTLAEQWGTHCPQESMPCGKMKFRPEFHSESSAYIHEATFHPVK